MTVSQDPPVPDSWPGRQAGGRDNRTPCRSSIQTNLRAARMVNRAPRVPEVECNVCQRRWKGAGGACSTASFLTTSSRRSRRLRDCTKGTQDLYATSDHTSAIFLPLSSFENKCTRCYFLLKTYQIPSSYLRGREDKRLSASVPCSGQPPLVQQHGSDLHATRNHEPKGHLLTLQTCGLLCSVV